MNVAVDLSGLPRSRSKRCGAIINGAARDSIADRRRKVPPYHHNVYVVELSKDVLNEPHFMKANPTYRLGKPCVYVGMTGLSPDDRFDKHKAGIKSNRYVRVYGLRLLPALYQVYNPMPYDAAREMEVELAIALREKGYGVWQA